MKCKNCNYDNPSNAQRCEQCNAPLLGSMLDSGVWGQHHDSASDRQGTVIDEPNMQGKNRTSNNTGSVSCPQCGYKVSPLMSRCPYCGSEISEMQQRQDKEPKHSTRPQTQMFGIGGGTPSFFTLRPIAWKNENIQYQPMSYCGDEIVLNRSNTDPNNVGITSKKQATIKNIDGEWYIVDNSEMQTTYVKARRMIKLQSGDRIILGNREFEFQQ